MPYRGDDTTGFPSPARDYLQPVIDLTEIISLRNPGVYAVRVKGEGLKERAILEDDILIADTTADPLPGKIAVIFTPEEALLGELTKKNGAIHVLMGDQENPINDHFEVWAIITRLVRTSI